MLNTAGLFHPETDMKNGLITQGLSKRCDHRQQSMSAIKPLNFDRI
jgi:hypothetical protein